ncbi:restriction endonuclease [Paenibacillus chondroitinus]|uniref:Restriction endonuclease n=1 Tax=Paenibacillus chondroitinus TaxID=59842 RepID=A0ABU6DKZ6_9BACL|nr:MULTISPECIES: restriction endonuclease [Paenibacillus]MCY9660979.1 restriction endonuclease [Paenibacillus anseongense]MEB4797962.1 restriction endonuclease [Paenibacillus chondroitinus]
MNSELGQLMNQSLLYPLIFIAAFIAVFSLIGVIIYSRIFVRWVPVKLASILWFVGAVFILFKCVNYYTEIQNMTKNWSMSGIVIGFIVFIVMIITCGVLISSKKKSKVKKSANKYGSSSKSQKPRVLQNRSDDEILNSSFDRLSGAEFERLLALYFRDQGYKVHEVGVGGKDGGVDLVIIDQRGEKTAVQAKCYANHNNVGVQIVRELVGAKRNHDCILSLLVTTSDLTEPAKKEAEQFKVDYWHGALLEQKLKAWGKWQPTNKKLKAQPVKQTAQVEIQRSQAQVSSSKETICSCGAPMVLRKGREGKQFFGCSTFPKCRHTKSQ